MGPVLAALIVVPFGQPASPGSRHRVLAIVILWRIGQCSAASRPGRSCGHPHRRADPRRVRIAARGVVALCFSKQLYVSSLSSYYIFI